MSWLAPARTRSCSNGIMATGNSRGCTVRLRSASQAFLAFIGLWLLALCGIIFKLPPINDARISSAALSPTRALEDTHDSLLSYRSNQAILIVPYMGEREHQRLSSHLKGLPRTEKQKLHVLFIRELNSSTPYLRTAWLMNAGLSHAAKITNTNSTCFVSHDATLLPNLTTIQYSNSCDVPSQLCYEQSCFQDGLPYFEYAGGVVSANRADWLQVNGYTCSAYDWGGEGDDLYWRFRQNKLLELVHHGVASEWMLQEKEEGQGRCQCDSTIRRPYGSYVDTHKIGDRIRRMSIKKSTEWMYDGLNSISYEISQIGTRRVGGIITTMIDVFEPDVVVDSGFRDHRKDKNDDKQSIVLLLAYRDRMAHYEHMIEHMNRLRRNVVKQWDLHVFVVEQMNSDLFRKGWLLNVGFHEIAKRFDPETTCVVQHDIDLLPNLDTINYEWCELPTQLCTEIPCLGSKFPYKGSCAGGVVAARLLDWQRINGYTLEAYGWGAEDDDIYFRFLANSLVAENARQKKMPPLRRPDEGFGYCDCVVDDVDHTKRQRHPNVYNSMMQKLGRMRNGSSEWQHDGYSNTSYELVRTYADEHGSSWIQVNYSQAQWSPPILELDQEGPQPIILMSIGRSGSTGIFHAIGNLTGEVIFANEYVGTNPSETIDFFGKYAFNDGQWLVDHLVSLQRRHPMAGIVGFKWKPYATSIKMGGATQALQRTSKTKPQIKVIHSYRNPLDVIISENKHIASNRSLNWFCKAGDEECVKQHKSYRVSLPTENLLQALKKDKKRRKDLEDLLSDNEVPYLTTTYEELYFGSDAKAWMKIFRFIGKGPTEGLTRDKVDSVFEFAKTSSLNHKKQLANYDDVKRLLTGTEFEGLLH